MSELDYRQLAAAFLKQLHGVSTAVVLTGAGVSTASGIPDFRGPNGLYSRVSPRVFELDFFMTYPEEYYKIALDRIHTMAGKEPNDNHFMLASLEDHGLIKSVITQNIDGLHKRSGTENVIELHGNLSTFKCLKCERVYEIAVVEGMARQVGVPRCDCGGLIKPCIIFFGEQLPYEALMKAQEYARSCNLFITMGTSLSVFPAADLPILTVKNNGRLFIINDEETQFDRIASVVYHCNLERFSAEVTALLDEELQSEDS